MKKQSAGLSICFIVFLCCQSGQQQNIETYKIKRATFRNSVTETGELEAVQSLMISAPNISWRLGSLKIVSLVEDGTQVKAGDKLVEFDKAEVLKNIDDAKAEMEIAQAELRKAQASQESQIDELKADLEKNKLSHRISQLNLDMAEFEAEIDRKKIELELENSAISLQKAEQEIENQIKVNQEEISKLALKVRQVLSKLTELKETLESLTVLAPAPGIAIIQRNWVTDVKFQVDDQPWRGSPMIALPDLSRMRAVVNINEVDIAKIDTLQNVVVKLDAAPDSIFHGQVKEVAALARNKERNSKVKVFDVKILINGQHASLMPGMTVSCEIIVDEVLDTIFIPIEALFKKQDQNIVYVHKRGRFEPQVVKTGIENDDYVIIAEGLKEGDEVALSDPWLYKEQKKETKAGVGG
jgi:HlyD family secretion protein